MKPQFDRDYKQNKQYVYTIEWGLGFVELRKNIFYKKGSDPFQISGTNFFSTENNIYRYTI